jgi:hypothetical protein
MIFIARNFNGEIVGIVSAKDKKSVIAYYQGTELRFNTLDSFDISEDRENEEMGYVTPILKTKIVKTFGGGMRYGEKDLEFVVVEK